MMGHDIRFKGVMWKIIPELSLLPFLILSTPLIWVLVSCWSHCISHISRSCCEILTLLYSEQPKFHRVLAILSATGLCNRVKLYDELL